MCNAYRFTDPLTRVIDEFSEMKIPLRFPTGMPNLQPLEDIRITDRAPVVVAEGEGAGRLEIMRWSWPGPKGAPVFNFRSEGRRFGQGRCLVLATGFFEYTASSQPGKKTKDKWLFTLAGDAPFAIAGYVREKSAKGEDAWTMLTAEPGPDVAPYHDRQVVVLPQARWADWLSGAPNEADLLRPLPAGSLKVEAA